MNDGTVLHIFQIVNKQAPVVKQRVAETARPKHGGSASIIRTASAPSNSAGMGIARVYDGLITGSEDPEISNVPFARLSLFLHRWGV